MTDHSEAMTSMAIDLPPAVLGTLQEGRQAYLAVASEGGPHVTPDLYGWSGGKLWMAVASSTLKAKVLRREPVAGALVTASGRAVMLQGDAEIFDPLDVVRWARHVPRTPELAQALAGYTVRNAPDLLAFVADTAAGRLGRRIPPRRVLVALTPYSAASIEGEEIVDAWGDWRVDGTEDDASEAGPGTPVVVGLPGPAAVPARWFEDRSCLVVSPAVLAMLGLQGTSRLPLGIVTDEYTAPGPAAKQGTLLRGHGRTTDQPGELEVELSRSIAWDGVEVTAADAEG